MIHNLNSDELQGLLYPIDSSAQVMLAKDDEVVHRWFKDVVIELERIAILYWRGKELFDPTTRRAYQRLNVAITDSLLSSAILSGSGFPANAMVTLRSAYERELELHHIFHDLREYKARARFWLTAERYIGQKDIRKSLSISNEEYKEFCSAAHMSGASFDKFYRKGDVKVPTPETDRIDDDLRRSDATSLPVMSVELIFPDYHEWEPGPGISKTAHELQGDATWRAMGGISLFISEICAKVTLSNLRAIRKVRHGSAKDEFALLMEYGRVCEHLKPSSLADHVISWYVDYRDEPLE